MTHFREPGLFADTAARFVQTRIKTCVSRSLAGIAEAFSAEKGEQDRNGLHAEAGDAVQQLLLLFQAGYGVRRSAGLLRVAAGD